MTERTPAGHIVAAAFIADIEQVIASQELSDVYHSHLMCSIIAEMEQHIEVKDTPHGLGTIRTYTLRLAGAE